MDCLSKQLFCEAPENRNTQIQMAAIGSIPNHTSSICRFTTNTLRCKSFKAIRPRGCRFSSLNQVKAASSSSSRSFDVVVVGAGIIGITIARQFLLQSDLSVALVDAAAPCAGATGAGQGYIWTVHKSPENAKWELMMRSRQLWETLAEEIQHQGMDPVEILGWKKTGSLLIGRTTEESHMLKKRVQQLSEAGLRAEFLSSRDLMEEEPAVRIGEEGGAAFLPDDYQMDAKRSVVYLEKINRSFSSEGRYAEFYHEPATGLLRSGNGEVIAIQTRNKTLHVKKAVVIAAGCWSGSLMHDLLRGSDVELDVPVKPRKVGYIDHQAATPSSTASDSTKVNARTTSVSMAATMDGLGNLVLGSSRQLVGFNTKIDETIINRIWERAGQFLPALRGLSLKSFCSSREVRVGLRPYNGKPVIGPVPSLPNLFLAAGHEGEGLSLAFGTAEMVADLVLGNPGKVDDSPYAVRC